jgi:anthranilate 1,2-dioxygenase large subunit
MDSYHAGLLHQFQATFGISRSTQRGGSHMDKLKRHRIIYVHYGSDDTEAAKAGYGDAKVIDDTLKLNDTRMIEFIDEFQDGRSILMMALFPNGFFQRLSNTLAARQIRPKSAGEFELHWTVFGYKSDDPDLRKRRLLQHNMIGPAGLVSIEDGEVGALIQDVLGANPKANTVIEMGGTGPIVDPDSPLTEIPVRGFWRYYCHLMGFEPEGGAAWRP